MPIFSDLVLDHFRNPRNAGELSGATHTVEVSNPVCGDILQLAVRLENGTFTAVRFLCRGCTTAIAAASMVTERLQNTTPAAAITLTAVEISEALGGLPAATFHGAQLAESAIKALSDSIRRS